MLACLPLPSKPKKPYTLFSGWRDDIDPEEDRWRKFSLPNYPCRKGEDCTAVCPGCNAKSMCILCDDDITRTHGLAGYSLCYICNFHMCTADPNRKCKNRKYFMSREDDERFSICTERCYDILDYVVPVNTLWILSKRGDLPLTKDVITVIFNILKKKKK
jgi:hypothetical protein